jgi:hypothetical protein
MTNNRLEISDDVKKISDDENTSFLNVNNWGEPVGTKHEVLQSVFFCGLGLHISFLIWGLLQERMLTQTYNGEYFVYSYGLVFINRLGCCFCYFVTLLLLLSTLPLLLFLLLASFAGDLSFALLAILFQPRVDIGPKPLRIFGLMSMIMCTQC